MIDKRLEEKMELIELAIEIALEDGGIAYVRAIINECELNSNGLTVQLVLFVAQQMGCMVHKNSRNEGWLILSGLGS